MGNYLYAPNYTDGIIFKYNNWDYMEPSVEYFNTFKEAKESLIDYYDRLIHESKIKLKQIKKLKEKDL